MDIEATFEANAQLAEACEPSMRALHNPAMLAKTVIRLDAAAGDARDDASLVQMATAACEVVPLVGVELLGAAPRSARQTRHRGYCIDQVFEHNGVVPVRPRHRHRQRDTASVYDEMSFAAKFAAIRGVRASLLAPRGAGHRCAIDARPSPIDLVMLTQACQQGQVQALPYAAGLPVAEATPAGHAATEAQFLRQVLPWDAGLQYEQDAVQRCPVVHSGAATFGRGFHHRQQRLQCLPQLVIDLLSCHDTWQRSTAMWR